MRCKSKKGAEETRLFETNGKEIFSNNGETKSDSTKEKKNGSRKREYCGQSVYFNLGGTKQYHLLSLSLSFSLSLYEITYLDRDTLVSVKHATIWSLRSLRSQDFQ